MLKREVLQEIFEIENISQKLVQCSKLSYKDLLDTLSKSSYSLKDELKLTHTTISKYLIKLFPDRPASTNKVDTWLLFKYGYKECKHCLNTLFLEDYHKNNNAKDGLNTYCKNCQNKLTAATSTFRQAKYRASKLQRTPKWLTLDDLTAIEIFYSNTPIGFHVDHIIPLQGDLVSGLHVLNNLQYLSASDNCSKCNSFEPF